MPFKRYVSILNMQGSVELADEHETHFLPEASL
jgi:hypothetical protein